MKQKSLPFKAPAEVLKDIQRQTRASTFSLLLITISAELEQSWLSVRKLNRLPLQAVACSTSWKQLKL
jgi:hypothetical protein